MCMSMFARMFIYIYKYKAQSADAVEYADCITAER